MMTDLKELFLESLDQEIKEQTKKSGVPIQDWAITGRKPYQPKGETEDWWRATGPEMLQAYSAWRKDTGWLIWVTPDGQRAVELPYRVPWTDAKPLLGYIDRIFLHPLTGELIVVDIKSGSRYPDERQLGEYACAVEIEYGVRPRYGMFFMTRPPSKKDKEQGKLYKEPKLINLDEYKHSFEYLKDESEKQERAIQHATEEDNFYTVPSNMCGSCTVRKFCPEFAEG